MNSFSLVRTVRTGGAVENCLLRRSLFQLLRQCIAKGCPAGVLAAAVVSSLIDMRLSGLLAGLSPLYPGIQTVMALEAAKSQTEAACL